MRGAGRGAAVHALVRQRRLRTPGGGQQHLRASGGGVLPADGAAGRDQVVPHLRPVQGEAEPRRQEADGPQRGDGRGGRHLVAVQLDDLRRPVPQHRQPHLGPRLVDILYNNV